MTYLEEVLRENFQNYKAMIKELLDDYSKQPTQGKQGEPTMKVSYKGVTGKLKKLEQGYNPYVDRDGYVLEIADETDGHKHVFENVDLSEIKFVWATVMLA